MSASRRIATPPSPVHQGVNNTTEARQMREVIGRDADMHRQLASFSLANGSCFNPPLPDATNVS
jgi:hypothetical protein